MDLKLDAITIENPASAPAAALAEAPQPVRGRRRGRRRRRAAAEAVVEMTKQEVAAAGPATLDCGNVDCLDRKG